MSPDEHPPFQESPSPDKPSILTYIDSLLNIFIIFEIVAIVGVGGFLAITRLK